MRISQVNAAETVEEVGQAVEREVTGIASYVDAAHLTQYGLIALRLALLVLVLTMVYRIVRFVIDRIMDRQRKRLDAKAASELMTAQKLMHSIAFYLLLFVGIISTLSILGYDIRGLVAGAGVAGIAVAFIAQSMIKDWVSGLFIIIEKQYGVGEWITVSGHTGQVQDVGIRSTTLKTDMNEVIYIPNGTITKIVNHSKYPQSKVLNIDVPYECDLDLAIRQLERAATVTNNTHEETLQKDVQVLGVQALANNSIQIGLAFACALPNHYAILRTLRKESLQALSEVGIDIPYPQLTVHPNQKESNLHADETLPGRHRSNP